MDDKQRGRQVDFGRMQNFINVVDYCLLKDMGFEGERFTWTNRSVESNTILKRLDRASSNES